MQKGFVRLEVALGGLALAAASLLALHATISVVSGETRLEIDRLAGRVLDLAAERLDDPAEIERLLESAQDSARDPGSAEIVYEARRQPGGEDFRLYPLSSSTTAARPPQSVRFRVRFEFPVDGSGRLVEQAGGFFEGAPADLDGDGIVDPDRDLDGEWRLLPVRIRLSSESGEGFGEVILHRLLDRA